MDLIEFNYTLQDGMMQIRNSIPDLPRTIHCYLPTEHSKKLMYTSLYLVCTHGYQPEDERHAEMHTYSRPLGIVAMRETEAVSYYKAITGEDDAISFAELVRNCSKLEVG